MCVNFVTVWNVKVKIGQSLYRPRGYQKVEVPRFQDIWQMKVVRLSALCTCHLSVRGWVDPRAIVKAWSIMSLKNSSRTCSAWTNCATAGPSLKCIIGLYTMFWCYLLTYLLTYILTYSMERSPSWEANWFCS